MHDVERETIAFAERMLALLDQASTTSTYKYAVLLSLMDLVLEKTNKDGSPPESVTTRQVAEKVVALYWPQTNKYLEMGTVLRQNSGGQAKILSVISDYRAHQKLGVGAPFHAARLSDRDGFELLLDRVEWVLIRYPLPLAQVLGKQNKKFIYQINWDSNIPKGQISNYQKGQSTNFDNQIRFLPDVPEQLLRLHALLRPLIQREWTRLVARMNRQPEARLEAFLFQHPRSWVARLRDPLRELQGGYCFYCHEQLESRPEVDHFIPWSRQPNDGLANLVLAHKRCNGYKRDFLAAGDHVHQWLRRLEPTGQKDDLDLIAREHRWELGLESSLGVASSIYLRLRPEMVLWRKEDDFELVEEATVELFRRLFSSENVA